MALPIPQSTIVASRVLILYASSLLFSCPVSYTHLATVPRVAKRRRPASGRVGPSQKTAAQ